MSQQLRHLIEQEESYQADVKKLEKAYQQKYEKEVADLKATINDLQVKIEDEKSQVVEVNEANLNDEKIAELKQEIQHKIGDAEKNITAKMKEILQTNLASA